MKSVKSINPFKSVIQTIAMILSNAHSGELKVETKEGEFAEFIIELPDVILENPVVI